MTSELIVLDFANTMLIIGSNVEFVEIILADLADRQRIYPRSNSIYESSRAALDSPIQGLHLEDSAPHWATLQIH